MSSHEEKVHLRPAMGFADLLLFFIMTGFSIRWIAAGGRCGSEFDCHLGWSRWPHSMFPSFSAFSNFLHVIQMKEASMFGANMLSESLPGL